jgi:hypothetical protein
MLFDIYGENLPEKVLTRDGIFNGRCFGRWYDIL